MLNKKHSECIRYFFFLYLLFVCICVCYSLLKFIRFLLFNILLFCWSIHVFYFCILPLLFSLLPCQKPPISASPLGRRVPYLLYVPLAPFCGPFLAASGDPVISDSRSLVPFLPTTPTFRKIPPLVAPFDLHPFAGSNFFCWCRFSAGIGRACLFVCRFFCVFTFAICLLIFGIPFVKVTAIPIRCFHMD